MVGSDAGLAAGLVDVQAGVEVGLEVAEDGGDLVRSGSFSHGSLPGSLPVVRFPLRLDQVLGGRPTPFSAQTAAKVIGWDNKTVSEYCLRGLIKSDRRKTKPLPQQGGDPHSIERADLRQFVIENLELIDLRRVDKFAVGGSVDFRRRFAGVRMTTDPILDEPFFACDFAAFVAEARASGTWPDPEKTRQRAYRLFEEELAAKSGRGDG